LETTVADPIWLANARRYLGLREYPGAKTNPTIEGWLKKLGASWRDDETAWCGTYVADNFLETGFSPVNGWSGARNWLKFGVGLPKPAVGAVVVFWRGSINGWSGHVGFVVGKDQSGNLMVLGGNQGDAVSVAAFSLDPKKTRVLGYRWPAGQPLPAANDNLPVVNSNGKLSANEA
jgi:uncharacterized protein (TIGR02594 family)